MNELDAFFAKVDGVLSDWRGSPDAMHEGDEPDRTPAAPWRGVPVVELRCVGGSRDGYVTRVPRMDQPCRESEEAPWPPLVPSTEFHVLRKGAGNGSDTYRTDFDAGLAYIVEEVPRMTTKAFERRMAVTGLEIRGAPGADVTLTGYASTYSDPYSMGWYDEDVNPAAFKRTFGQKPDVRFLINHEGLPLARTTSGTLTFDEADEHGLAPFASVNKNDPDVASLLPKIERGDVNQMSFSFRTTEEAWNDDMTKRTLLSLDLHNGDVSVVTFPANPNTTVAARAAGRNVEAVQSAMRALEHRSASDEDIASVLTRALGYFTAVDLIVDNAQDEIAEALGIPNPDEDDGIAEPDADDSAETLRARLAGEYRRRLLSLL